MKIKRNKLFVLHTVRACTRYSREIASQSGSGWSTHEKTKDKRNELESPACVSVCACAMDAWMSDYLFSLAWIFPASFVSCTSQVKYPLGSLSNFFGVSNSTSRPASNTRIRSLSKIVFNRWAIVKTVQSANCSATKRFKSWSVSKSSELVASDKKKDKQKDQKGNGWVREQCQRKNAWWRISRVVVRLTVHDDNLTISDDRATET